ncbi:MAG: hypothetical protein ACR2RE_21520 [Geminicoccaceae bacterium]
MKLEARQCGASQAARDDVGEDERESLRDKVVQGVTLQPVHASSSALTEALHQAAPSSSPDLD